MRVTFHIRYSKGCYVATRHTVTYLLSFYKCDSRTITVDQLVSVSEDIQKGADPVKTTKVCFACDAPSLSMLSRANQFQTTRLKAVALAHTNTHATVSGSFVDICR